MALTNHNTSAIVRSALGAATYVWRLLIIHANINMWSRFKPTRYNGATPADFWKGSDGKCGFSLPFLSGSTYTPSNWEYLKPRGGAAYSEPFRGGDFRGYEHSAALLPPFYSDQADNDVPAELSPVTLGGSWYHIATFYLRACVDTVTRMRPVDLGLNAYYFGVRYRTPEGTWYYKTAPHTLDWRTTESLAQSVSIDVEYNPETGGFVDAPFGTGAVSIELIICSSECPAWTVTKPTTVIKLPAFVINGHTLVNTGSFTILDWIYGTVLNMIFGNSDGLSEYQSSIITTSAAQWTIESHPAWISHAVYRSGVLVSGVNPYLSGDELRLYPGSVNTGDTRNGSVVLGPNLEISVEQFGHNPVVDNWDLTGLGITDNTCNLYADQTDVTVQFRPNVSGTRWITLWDTDHGYFMGWTQMTLTSGSLKTQHLYPAAGDIHYGGNYTVYITNVDPNL